MTPVINGEGAQLESSKEQIWEKEQTQSNLIDKGLISSFTNTLPNLTEEKAFSSTKSRWAWTGFHDKTLWDWLQFIASIAASIALPVLLAMYASQQQFAAEEKNQNDKHLAEQRNREEKALALDNQRHEIMADYFDDMTDLMLKQGLAKSSSDGQVKLLASARTLNTLRQLDGGRKGQLLKFLHEANLVGHECQINSTTLRASDCRTAILDLDGAKLEKMTIEAPIRLQKIDLTRASLAEADLPRIDLTQADMKEADLRSANLTGALLPDAQMERTNLEGITLVDAILPRAMLLNADLRDADLRGADLREARLSNANLQGANLSNANLQKANLGGANLIGANLEGVDFKGAKYNSTTKFPEGFNLDGQGMQGVLQ